MTKLDEQVRRLQDEQRQRESKRAAPLPFNHKLQARLSEYEHGAGKIAFPGEYHRRCKHCGDTGIVYVKEDYIVNGRKLGEWEVQKPCPKCAAPRCLVCLDSGVISYALPIEHPDFGRLFFCECGKGRAMAIEAQSRALRNAELPNHYQSLTFATWDSLPPEQRIGKELARMAVELWVTLASERHMFSIADVYLALGYNADGIDTRPRNSIILSGTYGVGKTGLAAAAVNALAAIGMPPLYMRTQELFSAMRNLMPKRGQTAEDVNGSPDEYLDRVKRCGALVLDELTTNQATDWRLDVIEELIRHRHGNSLPTIVTTNSTRGQIEQEWGLRTASTLLAMAHFITVEGAPIRDEGYDYAG